MGRSLVQGMYVDQVPQCIAYSSYLDQKSPLAGFVAELQTKRVERVHRGRTRDNKIRTFSLKKTRTRPQRARLETGD